MPSFKEQLTKSLDFAANRDDAIDESVSDLKIWPATGYAFYFFFRHKKWKGENSLQSYKNKAEIAFFGLKIRKKKTVLGHLL